MIGRVALLGAVAIAMVNALQSRPLNRGSFCPKEGTLPSGNAWPKGWNKCPKTDHYYLSYPADDCCVAQCMSQLLVTENFTVCAGSSNGGQQIDDFSWSSHFCDCSFKEYCVAACNPTCKLLPRERRDYDIRAIDSLITNIIEKSISAEERDESFREQFV